ncbi:MAG: diacylglyceryl transferase, partial [Gemmobacter sp.]
IASAVMACERYYPAFQLVGWGGRSPEAALEVAIAEAYGRA